MDSGKEYGLDGGLLGSRTRGVVTLGKEERENARYWEHKRERWFCTGRILVSWWRLLMGDFFGGASTDVEGLVLEKFVYVIIGGVRKQDRTGIGGNRTEECVVSGKEIVIKILSFYTHLKSSAA